MTLGDVKQGVRFQGFQGSQGFKGVPGVEGMSKNPRFERGEEFLKETVELFWGKNSSEFWSEGGGLGLGGGAGGRGI